MNIPMTKVFTLAIIDHHRDGGVSRKYGEYAIAGDPEDALAYLQSEVDTECKCLRASGYGDVEVHDWTTDFSKSIHYGGGIVEFHIECHKLVRRIKK